MNVDFVHDKNFGSSTNAVISVFGGLYWNWTQSGKWVLIILFPYSIIIEPVFEF